jgi:hypothetical protein
MIDMAHLGAMVGGAFCRESRLDANRHLQELVPVPRRIAALPDDPFHAGALALAAPIGDSFSGGSYAGHADEGSRRRGRMTSGAATRRDG